MRFAALVFPFFMAACATTAGPVGSAEFPALVAAAAPGEQVLVSGPGTWTPNSRRILEFANTGDFMNPTGMPWKDGVTLITPAGLSFAEWDGDARRYVVTKRIARAAMASVAIDAQGRSCALVVQEAADATFHVFEFTRGALNDCARARQAAAALGG